VFSGDRRSKALTLGAMCFALFMAMLDNTVVNVALPSIQNHLGSGVSGLQWVISGYTLLFASLMLTGGTLGDIFGRRLAFLAGVTVFTAGSLLCGLAPSMAVLIGGRVIQGIGAALLLPGTLSILTNTFTDPRERAQAIGLWAGISGLALALGPVVGGILVDSLGWQSVFFLNVPIGIVAFMVTMRVVSESKNPEGRHLDLPGQALAIVALGSATYALIEANNYGWHSPLILSLFSVAVVAEAAFLWTEHRSSSPMLQLSFFRNRTLTAALTVAGLVSFGMFGTFFFLTLYLQTVQGYSALGMGIRGLAISGMIIVTAPLAGRVAGRIGSRIPMTAGLALNGAGLLLLTRITPTMSYSLLWWNLAMLGVGMGLVMTPMTAAVMSAVPRARAGMASATTNATREIGGVFGIALLGAIVTHWFASDLATSLRGFALPAATKAQIVALASHGGTEATKGLPPGVNAQALHTAIDNAFVSGMHVALVVAGAALLGGSVVAFALVRGGVPTAEVAPATAVTGTTEAVEPANAPAVPILTPAAATGEAAVPATASLDQVTGLPAGGTTVAAGVTGDEAA
jgi:MFS transporter, DHA2 family, methylenomycin A resistance protein